ncbi:GNAT family N-acetyltransferase [Rosenbergiella australiborealis]|uniref:GNAT family N-acetyltransferase n=1 Tax=Rosenbergiella australiborealis TaxID=1544696 RepID=UPI001F4E8066|nr:GNAT family N-acetyltransferase [Rosenbergiella australiborealis]
MQTQRLETARLYLEPLTLEDAPKIQACFPRWEIVKYLTRKVPWPYPDNGADSFCRASLAAMEKETDWIWTLRPKSNHSQVIGLIRLALEPNNNRGFWLVPEWQGQGYMSEACDAATTFWFTVLGQSVLRAPKAKLNYASQKISEKTGMRIIDEGIGEYHIGDVASTLWEITHDEWLAQNNI